MPFKACWPVMCCADLCRRACLRVAVMFAAVAIAACSDKPPAPQKAAPKPSPAEAPSPQTSSASPAPVAPQTIRTSKGTFTVPGKAFADGRDPEATPRLTVMRINVWDGIPRRQRV